MTKGRSSQVATPPRNLLKWPSESPIKRSLFARETPRPTPRARLVSNRLRPRKRVALLDRATPPILPPTQGEDERESEGRQPVRRH